MMKEEVFNSGNKVYTFREQYEGVWIVDIKDATEKYSQRLCTVNYYDHSKCWRISETIPQEYADYVANLRLPTKELAATVYEAIQRRSQEVIAKQPLPDDVGRYLEDRASHLRDEEQKALSKFMQIRHERYQLNKFAKSYNLNSLCWRTDDSDADETIKDFWNLKVDDQTLVDYLYENLGKDFGRTYRAMLGRMLKCYNPQMVEELDI